MSVVGIVIVVVIAIFAASILGAWLRGGTGTGPQGDSKAVREDVHRMLTTQAQGFAAQMGELTQMVTQQLSEVKRELEQGVTTSSQITADAQRDMTEQLRSSGDVLTRLNQHLGEMQKSGQELTQAAQTMQAVLGGPKSRGVLGEAQLESLLADVLPKSGYDLDHDFANGATATAVLRAGRKLVAIDAEFPLDACRKVIEKGEEARGEFAAAVRKHVDEVAETYILPHEGTLDLALMFVPSESAFVELLLTEDEQGRLDDYCRQKHVLPVSPNSLHAYLGAILIGLKGMEFEENAKQMLAGLETVKKEFEEFGQVYAKVGEKLQGARDTYEDAGRRLAGAQAALAATAVTEPAKAVEAETEENHEENAQESEEATPVSVDASNNGAA
jgi:DNA recombination protein RmuC